MPVKATIVVKYTSNGQIIVKYAINGEDYCIV